jgi:hypothetical protein
MRERGSAFIETIVAAAIVSVSLGTAYHVLANSIARDRAVNARREAMLIAQSELAAVGNAIPVSGGNNAGEEGAYVWRVQIAPYSSGTASAVGNLWQVTVTVQKKGGPILATLHTVKLAPA